MVGVLRTWLGLVFVLSGLAKIDSPDEAMRFAARRFRIPGSWARVAVVVVSVAEAGIGVALVFGVSVQLTAGVASVLALAFLGMSVVNDPATGHGCGCLGRLGPRAPSRRVMVCRDLLVFTTGVVVLIWPDKSRDVSTILVGIALMVVTLIAYLLFPGEIAGTSATSQTRRGLASSVHVDK